MEETTHHTSGEHHHKSKKTELSLPVAIVIAAFIIGIALIVIKSPRVIVQKDTDTKSQAVLEPETINAMVKNIFASKNNDQKKLLPVSQKDHMVGASSPKITIIEYSDLECPFCRSFHATMNKVMRKYSDNVSWVYRHFPLDCVDNKDPECVPLHSKARSEALASECAFEQGGNDVFFTYINMVFQVTPSNNRLDPKVLTETAQGVGLNMDKFGTCIASKKYDKVVSDNTVSGINVGVHGTPTSFIIDKDGNTYQLQGALPYEVIASAVDTLLK